MLSWALLGLGRLEEGVHGLEAWLSLPTLGNDEEGKVATVGAAIPAAIFFNHFSHRIREMGARMDDFALEFLNMAERSFGE